MPEYSIDELIITSSDGVKVCLGVTTVGLVLISQI